mmetsp:Transcript_17869/g.40616  ORF Transcript_17869/g.40616 Transcript_17869/m.40616 type:complete len:87 (+) Transcript_17869:1401-1661(+)
MDSSGYLKDLLSQLILLEGLTANIVQDLDTLVSEFKALNQKYSDRFENYVSYISIYKTEIKKGFSEIQAHIGKSNYGYLSQDRKKF